MNASRKLNQEELEEEGKASVQREETVSDVQGMNAFRKHQMGK